MALPVRFRIGTIVVVGCFACAQPHGEDDALVHSTKQGGTPAAADSCSWSAPVEMPGATGTGYAWLWTTRYDSNRLLTAGIPVVWDAEEEIFEPESRLVLFMDDGSDLPSPSGNFSFRYPWIAWDDDRDLLHLFWFEPLEKRPEPTADWGDRVHEVWYARYLESSGWSDPMPIITDSVRLHADRFDALLDEVGGLHWAVRSGNPGRPRIHYVSIRPQAEHVEYQEIPARMGFWVRFLRHDGRTFLFSGVIPEITPGPIRLYPDSILWAWEVSEGRPVSSGHRIEMPGIETMGWLAAFSGRGESARLVIGEDDGGFSVRRFHYAEWSPGADRLDIERPPLALADGAYEPRAVVAGDGAIHIVYRVEDRNSDGNEIEVLTHATWRGGAWHAPTRPFPDLYVLDFSVFDTGDGDIGARVSVADRLWIRSDSFRAGPDASPPKLLSALCRGGVHSSPGSTIQHSLPIQGG